MTRDINISPVLNGFICQVGYQIVVFDNKERLISTLKDYLNNSLAVERWFLENSINKDIASQPIACAEQPARSISDIANTLGVTQ